MIAYDPTYLEVRPPYFGYSNYGSGIWNPKSMQSTPEVIRLAKEAGITILRFPGGNHSWFYNWKKTIGPPHQRPNFLYGLDEFLKTCEEIGAEAVFTLPYLTGTPQDAADLVEYLNAPDNGTNYNGGIDWAKERTKNGHPLPYTVRFFELGSELMYGEPKKGVQPADPAKYANDYPVYKRAMIAVDPSIKLGAVTVNSGSGEWRRLVWNDAVFRTAGQEIDFLIEHTYRPGYASNEENIDINRLFTDTLRRLVEVDKYYKTISKQFYVLTGRKNIPIAVTEYNGGFEQNKPVPFRHSLGTALFNAGLIQILMKPENNILFANYWQFVNSYWGMIKNEQYMEDKGFYIKRPNYYTFEMFHKHFGTNLVGVSFDSSMAVALNNNKSLLSGIKWKIEHIPGANIRTVKNNVEISFTGESDLNFYHVYKKISVKPNTTYYLSGYIKTEYLEDKQGVSLEIEDSRGWDRVRSNARTERVKGTVDWIYVETEYTTLPDASGVSIIVRRVSRSSGVIKGKVFVRDVKLIEKPANEPDTENTLSISASKSRDEKILYLIVLNKNVYEDTRATILLRDFMVSKNVNVWTLNGPSVGATNEKAPDSVNIQHKRIELAGGSKLDYAFPAHSLTSLEFNLE